MKHHPIALVVDFQFTIKPFSLSWPSYRIFLPFVVHSHLVLRSRSDEVPRKAEWRLRFESRCHERGARTYRGGHVLCCTSAKRVGVGLCRKRGRGWPNNLDSR